VAAFASTQAMRTLLFGITPVDPVTFVAVPCLLLITAAAATWIPAARVSRTDPARTLRED
jgi:putative ABC transport system permease protein